jgi:hypothetical protein
MGWLSAHDLWVWPGPVAQATRSAWGTRLIRWWPEKLTGESGPRRGGSVVEEPRCSGSDGGSGGLGQHRRGPAVGGGKWKSEACIHC